MEQLYGIGFAIIFTMIAMSVYENPQKWIDFFSLSNEEEDE